MIVCTLPPELGISLLGEWLVIKESAKLDTALCSAALRTSFLELLKLVHRVPSFHLFYCKCCSPTLAFYRWADLRDVAIGSIFCDKKLLADDNLIFKMNTAYLDTIEVEPHLVQFLPIINACTTLTHLDCCSEMFCQIEPSVLKTLTKLSVDLGSFEDINDADFESPNTARLLTSIDLLRGNCFKLVDLSFPYIDEVSDPFVDFVKQCSSLKILSFHTNRREVADRVIASVDHTLDALYMGSEFDFSLVSQMLRVATMIHCHDYEAGSTIAIDQLESSRCFKIQSHKKVNDGGWKEFLLGFKDLIMLQITRSDVFLGDDEMVAILHHSGATLQAVEIEFQLFGSDVLKLLLHTTAKTLTKLYLCDDQYSEEEIVDAFSDVTTALTDVELSLGELSDTTKDAIKGACPKLEQLSYGYDESGQRALEALIVIADID